MCYNHPMLPHFVYAKARRGFGWHMEDSFWASETLPIFSIADGVTLSQYISIKSPTLAKEAADIFCKASIEYLEKHLDPYSISSIPSNKVSSETMYQAYNYAKDKIHELYEKRMTDNDNRRGVTAAVAVVGKETVISSRFLDSGLALFRGKKEIFKTPEFWQWQRVNDNKTYPYITLNSDMKDYVQAYEIPYEKGDLLVLYTDGFENQFSLAKFTSIFASKNLDEVKKKLESLDVKLSKKDSEKWGHERTMAVVQL